MKVHRQALPTSLSSEDVARVIHGAIRRLGSDGFGWEAAWVDEAPVVREALRMQVEAIRDRPGKTAAQIREEAGHKPLPKMQMAIEEMMVAIVRALEPVVDGN